MSKLDSQLSVLFSFATLRNTTTLCACNLSKLWVCREATSVTVATTFTTDLGVKVFAIFVLISRGSFLTTSFSSSHF